MDLQAAGHQPMVTEDQLKGQVDEQVLLLVTSQDQALQDHLDYVCIFCLSISLIT